MKPFSLLTFLLLISLSAFAQNQLPIIKATSDKAYFTEGKNKTKSNWWLDPDAKPDIYKTNKIKKSELISFHTDIESLKVRIKPGETYSFIVLLNGKDSCLTQIVATPIITQYRDINPATHDTIPFTLTSGNNIKISVLLNGSDSLDLFFDSGATSIVLTHDAIANKTSLLAGKEKGFKTRNYVRLSTLSTLKIGKRTWTGLKIYPVSVTGEDTDGHFGWNLFDGQIVEIDYDKNIMIVHSSLDKHPKGYSKSKIEYINTLFCIQGQLVANGKKYKNRFLFDTGYQRAILLDSVLMKEQNFPQDLPIIKTTTLRNGAGKVFHTKIVSSEMLTLGTANAADIPSQLLNTANPAQFKTHILGNELLKRFNTILDFQHDYVYLKPNGLMNLPYIDES